jgi:hypothetical protein
MSTISGHYAIARIASRKRGVWCVPIVEGLSWSGCLADIINSISAFAFTTTLPRFYFSFMYNLSGYLSSVRHIQRTALKSVPSKVVKDFFTRSGLQHWQHTKVKSSRGSNSYTFSATVIGSSPTVEFANNSRSSPSFRIPVLYFSKRDFPLCTLFSKQTPLTIGLNPKGKLEI